MTDLPYLEPLTLWLQRDENLKNHFTEKSFFMPHADLITATEEAMKKDCPAPRALWIIPQDTVAQTRKPGCRSPGIHTFYISIITQCIRESFYFSKDGTGVHLAGPFMDLAELRLFVKNSVMAFMNNYAKPGSPNKFGDLVWIKDQMLYPNGESKFLITTLQFEVKIF